MPKFAANLMYLFQEWPMPERFKAARDAGFSAVEFNFPYTVDLALMQEGLLANGLEMALINAPPGDYAKGERGIAAFPDRVGEFEDSFKRALGYARELDCRRIHIMSGVLREGDAADIAMATYADNLRFAAELASAEGVSVLVEPLNPIDVPGYLITGVMQARALLSMLGAGGVRLQFDAYHALVRGDDPIEMVRANLDIIDHVQIAGFPGRAEPTGAVYGGAGGLFETLDMLSYRGFVGCEYKPRAGTLQGLGWASVYGISS
ncbi:MAG: TIM barrel protein [Proteobacteria bacterium]|nr:TIM barrel protein [Pseudomonadota bacterium]